MKALGCGELHDCDRHGTFGGATCGIPAEGLLRDCQEFGLLSSFRGSSARIPGQLGRNLFINGVVPSVWTQENASTQIVSPAVVWINAGHLFFEVLEADVLAGAYFEAIASYAASRE